jgi:hypothetical protein
LIHELLGGLVGSTLSSNALAISSEGTVSGGFGGGVAAEGMTNFFGLKKTA